MRFPPSNRRSYCENRSPGPPVAPPGLRLALHLGPCRGTGSAVRVNDGVTPRAGCCGRGIRTTWVTARFRGGTSGVAERGAHVGPLGGGGACSRRGDPGGQGPGEQPPTSACPADRLANPRAPLALTPAAPKSREPTQTRGRGRGRHRACGPAWKGPHLSTRVLSVRPCRCPIGGPKITEVTI